MVSLFRKRGKRLYLSSLVLGGIYLAGSASLIDGALAYDSPPMCDPNENPTVCGLKIERNNAMDEAAMSAGKIQEIKLHEQKVAQWWKEYYKHIPDLIVLDGHMKKVCAQIALSQEQHGVHSKSLTDMCMWWRTRKANW